MADRMILHIDKKGLFLSPYSKEELYAEGKLNLQKFSEAECVSGCTFAEALVAATIEGRYKTTNWTDEYRYYIKQEVFCTYKELNSLVKMLTNTDISNACEEQRDELLSEFYRFYTAIYGWEERIIEKIPEQFFVPCFYPAVQVGCEDIDIYSQYDKYELRGFANAIFNYSLNKQAFELLRVNSDEVSDIQMLSKKLEQAKQVPCLEFDTLKIASITEQLKDYERVMLQYIHDKHKDDITYIDEKKVQQKLYLHEKLALETIRGKKEIIPDRLCLALETIESFVVEHLQKKYGFTDEVKTDADSRILAVYNSKKIRSKADWGVVYRLMVEQGIIIKDSYLAAAEWINRVCNQKVTNADAIRKSPAANDMKGAYNSTEGWSMKTENRESSGMLEKYNEIAKIYMDKK